MPEEDSFIKNLIFRLIKKHISGATINSAFKLAKSLNEEGTHTSITFLNENPNDAIKARYNLNAYINLAKQISRLNIDSSISLRLSQIGIKLSSDLFRKNMDEIIKISNSLGIVLWLEYEKDVNYNNIFDTYMAYADNFRHIGIELPIRNIKIDNYLVKLKDKALIKLTYHSYNKEPEIKSKKHLTIVDSYSIAIDQINSKLNELYIIEPEEKVINRLVEKNRVYKRNLIFEMPLGYSKKWKKKFEKKKIGLSVYLPYGKDWIPYAIDKLTEGRIRNLAITFLDGKKTREKNGKLAKTKK